MKKGFTLIEIIGVVIILGVIVIIAFPPLLNFVKKTNSEIDDATKTLIFSATSQYIGQYQNDFPTINGNIYCVTVRNLVSENYISNLNLNDSETLDSKIKIEVIGDKYQYSIDNSCTSYTPSAVTFTVLGNAINSNGWASSEFYVQVNVNNANSYKWCSTTSDTCTPTALVTENTNTVLISSPSTTNKICVQAKNGNDEEQDITCSDNYKLDSNLPNIASNSGNYVVVTPTTSINVIDYFNYSASGSSNITSTSCKNTTANQDITETSSLAIGEYNIECTATTESGASNSANITLSISNCFNYSSSSINDYYCYVGNTGGYQEISNVTIPYSINKNIVNTIGSSAFKSNQLTSVTIPNSVTSIGLYAFESNQLTGITIPNSVTSIGNFAFYTNQLTSVTIPNSVTSIGDYTFASNQIASLIIPNSVTSIGDSTFSYNYLTTVTIPNSVTSIGEYAFRSNQLTSVTIGNSVTNIGGWAFISNQLTSVTIPNSVISIGPDAFQYNKLTSVTIGNSVTSIGGWAFASNQIASLIIPNSVTSIGTQAFAYNPFTSVIIPASVTNISGNPFSGILLTSITVDSNNLNYKSINNAIYTIDGTKLVTGNKNIGDSIESSVTEIGSYAFYNNQLTSVTVPTIVTSIGESAFQSNQLTSVTIPNSVTSIGTYAFWSNKLTSVTIPNSVTNIGSSAFSYNKLTNVTLGTGLTSIGSSAFSKSSSSNPITSIYNNSGKTFDWTSITSSSTTGQSFVTGTITHQNGNITVTTN